MVKKNMSVIYDPRQLDQLVKPLKDKHEAKDFW